MSMTLKEEHDYTGITEVPSMEASEKHETKKKGLNLKATELRLGLPGSESPEREIVHGVKDKNGGYSLGVLKGLVSGGKRGFFDTINGDCCGKWILNRGAGSEVNFSPKGFYASVKPLGAGEAVISTSQSFMVSTSGRETALSPSTGLGQEKKPQISTLIGHGIAPAPKTQVVGWPPVRSFRKNSMTNNPLKTDENADVKLGTSYVKVSMDGAPYLRKVHIKTYNSYKDLSSALEKMFSCFTIGQCGSHGVHIQDENSESRLMDLLHGSEYVLTYEDKDEDWMLVGDVPWDMFIGSCKRLRIMKSSDAVGLAPRAREKCRIR